MRILVIFLVAIVINIIYVYMCRWIYLLEGIRLASLGVDEQHKREIQRKTLVGFVLQWLAVFVIHEVILIKEAKVLGWSFTATSGKAVMMTGLFLICAETIRSVLEFLYTQFKNRGQGPRLRP